MSQESVTGKYGTDTPERGSKAVPRVEVAAEPRDKNSRPFTKRSLRCGRGDWRASLTPLARRPEHNDHLTKRTSQAAELEAKAGSQYDALASGQVANGISDWTEPFSESDDDQRATALDPGLLDAEKDPSTVDDESNTDNTEPPPLSSFSRQASAPFPSVFK